MTTRRGRQGRGTPTAQPLDFRPQRRRRPPQGTRRIPWKALIPLAVLLAGIGVAVIVNYLVSVKGPGDVPILQVNARTFPWRYYVTLVKSQKLQTEAFGQQFDAGRAPYSALQAMAEDELLRQGAPREGLHVSEADIKASMMSRLGVDTSGTDKGAIERDFQVRLKNQLTIAQMSFGMYHEQVHAELLKEQMRTKLGENIPRVQRQAYLHIIRVADQQAAGQVSQRLANGDPFERIARDASTDSTAPQGGVLGWTPRLVFFDYADFLFGLDVGEVSAPIPGDNGFYVIRLIERVNDQARLRGIFVKDVQAAQAVSQRLDRGELFEEVAASAANLDAELRGKRGDMGLVSVGAYKGIFDSSIRGSELNKVTEALSDPAGSGLIFLKVSQRADAVEVSDANLQVLKQRALEAWLRREQANNRVNFCPAGEDNCFGSKKVEKLMREIGDVSFTKFQEQLTATAVAASRQN